MCYNEEVNPIQKKERIVNPSAEIPRAPETNFELPESGGEKEPASTEGERKNAAEEVLPKKSFRRPIAAPRPALSDPLAQKIEKILEENVGDAYSRLSPIAKQEFKLRGEITAQKISELLLTTHIKVKKIFQLILEWLKLLPGVNHFFLEQEAKIKTDQIIALHKK
ncbi:MAG: hypothetical protein AAB467_00930 [Patescibacteria group bacterium]